jgi:hypothetical protein
MTENIDQLRKEWGIEPDPEFREGQVYRATVQELRFEQSRLYPGTTFPRIFFQVSDEDGRQMKMSWIGTCPKAEAQAAICRIDAQAFSKPPAALAGKTCFVTVKMSRGICVQDIVDPAGNPNQPTAAPKQ